MGMFEGMFGPKKNPDGTIMSDQEKLNAKLEKERSRFRNNVDGLNSDVERKGGWSRVKNFLGIGYSELGETVAMGAGMAVMVASGPVTTGIMFGFLCWKAAEAFAEKGSQKTPQNTA